MSQLIKFDLSGLEAVDLGGQREKFEELVRAAVADIQRRPSVGKPREITIKLRFEPHPDDPDSLFFGMELGSKTPGFKSEPAKMMIHRNQEISFAGTSDDEEDN